MPTHILQPPKSSLRISLYIFAVYIFVSALWSLSGISAEGTGYVINVIAAAVGFFYAKTHGNCLSKKQSFFVSFYVFCFLYLLNVAPHIYSLLSDITEHVPTSEVLPTLLIAIGMISLIPLLQILLVYLFFRMGYSLGLQKSNRKPQK